MQKAKDANDKKATKKEKKKILASTIHPQYQYQCPLSIKLNKIKQKTKKSKCARVH